MSHPPRSGRRAGDPAASVSGPATIRARFCGPGTTATSGVAMAGQGGRRGACPYQ